MTMESRLPLYQKSLDWNAFRRDFPVPDVFAETVFKWDRGKLRDLQNQRFRDIMAVGWKNQFYRKRWSEAGLRPEDVKGLDDIGKLPTFNSDDIKDDQAAHPPFGHISGVTARDLVHTPIKLQTSGGTTGKPRFTLYGPLEWEMNALTVARGIYIQGVRPGDVYQIPATLSLANLGWCVYKACHDYLGVLPVTTGSGVVTSSRRQLELAFDLGTSCWMSFPEYMTPLANVCRTELGRDPRDLKTKVISSFLGPDLEGRLRNQLQDLFGCKVYDDYGTNELGLAAFECPEQNGLHFQEDAMFFEVVDPETGEPVKDGERGDLVATLLYRTIPPIIRFNLRDLARIVGAEKCGCGSHFRRMDHFLGRSDDMVKLRGTNLYPMACLSAVKSDDRTTGEWICVVDRHQSEGGVIRDEMTVRVETRRAAGSLDGLQAHLERRLYADLGVKVAVELVDEGNLAEVANLGREGKPKRLLDRRFNK
jgi:phenylacetate-CoA ligase